ncbi:hypothetical protein DH2020_003200 [Rehmannia glutinosa]|uniref:Retrotransposon Copia-like N-terminal domain-containing protein n=1 Tax=Rehmannia glutinosa TaxID=99300 RepID=A0ABR0XL45_REHGL
MAPTETAIVQLNAPTHFPIKLTAANFPVWSRQVQSTLIGFDLVGYIDGTKTSPNKFTDEARKVINPEYLIWFRQDQILISALLGSCSDTIQPIISSATTAFDAWQRLQMSYANTSRGRVVSLKAKLAKNPKGNKSVTEFLHEMRSIADDLALAQSPISEEDLVVHIITQLGDEFNSIVAALRVRETPVAFSELSDILTDFERLMKENDDAHQSVLATANVTQKHTSKPPNSNRQFNAPRDQGWSSNFRRPRGGQSTNYNRQNPSGTRSGRFCQFCEYPGHEVRTCRKLAKLLKTNNLQLSDSQFIHTASP